MKISEIKEYLKDLEKIAFQLPDGNLVPAHFHVTEIGKISKKFIDCGGTIRSEEKASFQLWEANDFNHRLHPEKLISIIELSEKVLELPDLEIEVEYQQGTIAKFDLGFDGRNFLLLNKQTDCLAKDECGVQNKPKLKMSELQSSSCKPNSGCC
ncbi:DUF6428 family protein [Zunongwangia sp. H14]|uniref:DUF6428 family protein n=1 Tax=Zunongwangia sp. H14 TaxID=3240792 RepID=UPI00356233C6